VGRLTTACDAVEGVPKVRRSWTERDLVERWTLFPDELALLSNKAGHTRLGFAVMLRFFAGEGRFPRDKREVPMEALRLVGVARRLFRSKHPHKEAGARLAPYPRRRPTPGLRPG
jgi:hypothetical protein